MTISDVRTAIFNRDGNKCCSCWSAESLCMDHVIPKPQFQIHTINNIQTLCKKCNFQKGMHPLPEEKFMIIEKYLLDANKIFTPPQQELMNSILFIHLIKGRIWFINFCLFHNFNC